MKRVIFYGILLTIASAGFTSCEKETYHNDTNATQYAKEEGEEDEFIDYIRGTISDISNIAIDNATVNLYYQSNLYASTSSDATGFYEFDRIPVGQYTIKALKTGYQNESVVVTLTEGQQLTQDFQLIAD